MYDAASKDLLIVVSALEARQGIMPLAIIMSLSYHTYGMFVAVPDP